MHSSSSIQDRNRPSKAVRLIFAFDGNKVELQSQQTVEMVLPPSHPVPHNDGEAGFWYELRDQADHLLYRRVLHDPMRDDVEVFSDDPQQTLSRAPQQIAGQNRKGVFVALIPDVELTTTVALFGSSQSCKDRSSRAIERRPATEIARFPINK